MLDPLATQIRSLRIKYFECEHHEFDYLSIYASVLCVASYFDPLCNGCSAQRAVGQVSVTDAAATEVATGEEDDIALNNKSG